MQIFRPSLKASRERNGVEDKRCQGEMRRVVRPDQRAEDRKSGNKHLLNPALAPAEALRRAAWCLPLVTAQSCGSCSQQRAECCSTVACAVGHGADLLFAWSHHVRNEA